MSAGRVLYGVVGLGLVGFVAGVVYASIYNAVASAAAGKQRPSS